MDINSTPNYMFKAKLIDFFFSWRWWVAQVIFVPLALAMLYVAFAVYDASLFTISMTFAMGFLLWTLAEYCLHRYLFHFIGESPRLKHFHYVVHGMHHAYPTNAERVIFPPFLSILVGVVLLAILMLIFPPNFVFGGLAGFALGYSWYEFIHYANHHVKWRFSPLKRLKRHHLLHHHSESFRDKNFGVTTVLWDHVFGTYLV